jgi:8-oxo-dGTP pyrophosphatase MutT (NUDIX family)
MTENKTTVRQAGAIVVKETGNKPFVLIVRAKKNPSDWIFPKGHVEEGETEEAAAERELLEEGGVKGTVISRIGQASHTLNDMDYVVTYFLLKYCSTETNGEPGREPTWCTVEEAMRRLSFPDSRMLLGKVFPESQKGNGV